MGQVASLRLTSKTVTQSSPSKVRSQLLAAQAEASPEITSHIAPDAARPLASNPLIDAAKQIAAQSSKKEI